MGLIFNRKKKPEPIPQEDVGNANIAKQVRAQTVTIQRDGVARTEHVSQPVVSASVVQSTHGKVAAVNQAHIDRGAPVYEFETLSDPHQRSRGWFIGMAIFFAAVVALNIVLRLYMSAVVIVLLALILFTTATRKNKKLMVRFFAAGLGLNDQFYPWHEFSKFWVLYEPPALKQLHFLRRTRLINELSIDLGSENPLKIRDMLLAFLPEDPTKEETRVDLVTRTFKL